MLTKTIEEPDDAITLLRAQRRDIDALLAALPRTTSARDRASLVTEGGDLIAVHLALEARVLRPLIATLGDDPPCLAAAEHAELTMGLAELLGRDVRDPALDVLATALRERLEAHGREVERCVLRKLRRRVPSARLRRLAHEMRVLEFDLRVNARPPLGVLATSALAASA